MLRPLALVAVLLASYGCATVEHCSDQHFFKAFLDGKSNPNRYFPGVAQFEPNDDAILRVSLCDRDNVKAICVEAYPAENVLFQFPEPRLTVLRKGAETSSDLRLEKITYKILCHGQTLSDSDAGCQSSTTSPLARDEKLAMDRLRTQKIGEHFYYINAYEFSPRATFKGVMVSGGLFVKFRRKYVAVTQPFHPAPGDEYVVSIPSVRIGNRTQEVPEVSFKYVKENVCLPNRPLSLQ